MTINTRKLNTITNVVAGQVATLDVPTGQRLYHRLEILVKDNGADVAAADLETFFEEIKVTVYGDAYGSVDLINLKAADYFECVLDFYKVEYEDGILIIPFTVDHFEGPLNRLAAGLGTGDLRSVQVEMKIKAAATAPSLEAYAVYDRVARPMGHVRRFAYSTETVAAAGDFEIANPNVLGNIGLKALHFATNKITSVEMKTNDLVQREGPLSLLVRENNYRATHTQGRAHGAAYTHLDFAGDDANRIMNMGGDQKKGIPAVNDFRLKLAMSGSEPSMRLITETVVGYGSTI